MPRNHPESAPQGNEDREVPNANTSESASQRIQVGGEHVEDFLERIIVPAI